LFPLCFSIRFIGKLSDSIKSRKHPEVNLANWYVRTVATRHNGFNSEAFEQENPLHPLIPVGSVQSIMDDQEIVNWPERTKHNSRYSPFHGKNSHNARLRIMLPLLGQEICDLNKAKPNYYSLVDFDKQSIQVGRWTYGLKLVEDKRKTGATRSSWFRIKVKHVPHYKQYDPDRVKDHGDDFVYGRINRFVQLDVWDQTFRLAEVLLFDSLFQDSITHHEVISLNKPLHTLNEFRILGRVRPLLHVQVKHLHSNVVVAPVELTKLTCSEVAARWLDATLNPNPYYFVIPLMV
jgi:hypothetical protein